MDTNNKEKQSNKVRLRANKKKDNLTDKSSTEYVENIAIDDKHNKRREQFIQFVKKNYSSFSSSGLIEVYDKHPDDAWHLYIINPPNILEKFIMGVK
jgi:hypothetical protein